MSPFDQDELVSVGEAWQLILQFRLSAAQLANCSVECRRDHDAQCIAFLGLAQARKHLAPLLSERRTPRLDTRIVENTQPDVPARRGPRFTVRVLKGDDPLYPG